MAKDRRLFGASLFADHRSHDCAGLFRGAGEGDAQGVEDGALCLLPGCRFDRLGGSRGDELRQDTGDVHGGMVAQG